MVYSHVAQPVRARVELLLVCRVLDSSANLCVLPRPAGMDDFEDEEDADDLRGLGCQSTQLSPAMNPLLVGSGR